MLFPIGRSTTRRLASTNFATSFARLAVVRAATKSQSNALGIYSQAIRGFASVGRPRQASTSKTVRATSTTKTPAKKPATKTTKATAKAQPKSKPKPKAASKPKLKSRSKPKTKAKSKAKPGRARKPVSEERRVMLERQLLKRHALFGEPKALGIQPYQVFVSEKTGGVTDGEMVINKIAAVARDYKALPPQEIERLKSIADQNKLTNAVAYKAWVESHSVQEIYDANKARRALKKKHNFPKRSLKVIHDDRLPKQPTGPYALFTKARWASGDYSLANATLAEVTSRIATEWKGLTAAERQPYDDLARSQTEHYQKSVSPLLNLPRSTGTKSPSPR